MHALDYLDQLPNSPEGKIFRFLHHLLSTYPEINTRIHFNTPFYTRHRWMVYVSGLKKGGVEICFVQASLYSKHQELLDFKKRKQVGGITYFKVEEIDVKVIDLLMTEAIETDEKTKPKSKKKHHKV
jgi:hypothetical protein